MNIYYHEFTPNLWHHFYPYVAIAFFIVMAMVGSRQHQLIWSRKRERYVIRQRYGESRLNGLSIVFAVILTTIITIESYDGILQSLDNRLGRYESGVWSLVMMPFFCLILTLACWFVLYWSGFIFSAVRFRLLTLRKEDLARKLAKMAGRERRQGYGE